MRCSFSLICGFIDPIITPITKDIFDALGKTPLANVVYFAINIGAIIAISGVTVVIPSQIAFSHKLDAVETMIKHVAEFELAKARCTVESDRAIVVKDVTDLFTLSTRSCRPILRRSCRCASGA